MLPHPRRVLWPALGLALCVSLLWMYTTDRWHPADWGLPVDCAGDALEVALRVEIAAEQGLTQANTFGPVARLGWPGTADWTLYPTPDRAEFLVAGQLSRLIGVFGAINVMMWLGYLLNALGFLIAARCLRWRSLWAFAGALLFAFSYHNFRWATSLSLNLTFAWPLTLVVLRWASGKSPAVGPTRPWLLAAVACGFTLGLGNPYFAFLAGQLGAFVLLRQLFVRQPARRQVALAFVSALIAAFAVTHLFYFAARFGGADAPGLERNFQGTELYALRPVEFLIPPVQHWSATFARLGTIYSSGTLFQGAERSAYLGLLAVAGLGLLLARSARTLGKFDRHPQAVPESMWAVGWVLFFSMAGGLNTLLGMAGLDLFRAASRYSLVPGLIGLFWLLAWVQRRTRGRPRLGWAAAIGLTVLGLWDQLPPPPRSRLRVEMQRRVDLNRATASALTTAVGAHAAVFQLPAVPFPEAGSRLGFGDYEHVPLVLYAPGLKLSYGGLLDSYPERLSRWLARQPNDRLPTLLADAGAQAVVIDRRAYPDHAENLARSFAAAGARPIDLPAGSPLIAFALDPAAEPSFPGPDDPRLRDPWREVSRHHLFSRELVREDGPQLFATAGWLPYEGDHRTGWRWASAPTSVVTVYDEDPPDAAVTLRFSIAALTEAPVRISWRGRVVWQGRVAPEPIDMLLTDLPIEAGGANDLVVEFEHPLVKPRYDARVFGVKLGDLQATYPRGEAPDRESARPSRHRQNRRASRPAPPSS